MQNLTLGTQKWQDICVFEQKSRTASRNNEEDTEAKAIAMLPLTART